VVVPRPPDKIPRPPPYASQVALSDWAKPLRRYSGTSGEAVGRAGRCDDPRS
jgi:hypothetical protein